METFIKDRVLFILSLVTIIVAIAKFIVMIKKNNYLTKITHVLNTICLLLLVLYCLPKLKITCNVFKCEKKNNHFFEIVRNLYILFSISNVLYTIFEIQRFDYIRGITYYFFTQMFYYLTSDIGSILKLYDLLPFQSTNLADLVLNIYVLISRLMILNIILTNIVFDETNKFKKQYVYGICDVFLFILLIGNSQNLDK